MSKNSFGKSLVFAAKAVEKAMGIPLQETEDGPIRHSVGECRKVIMEIFGNFHSTRKSLGFD